MPRMRFIGQVGLMVGLAMAMASSCASAQPALVPPSELFAPQLSVRTMFEGLLNTMFEGRGAKEKPA